MQLIEIELDPQETAIAEAGAFMYMDQAIEMQTIFGDGSAQTGFMGKLFSAGKVLKQKLIVGCLCQGIQLEQSPVLRREHGKNVS